MYWVTPCHLAGDDGALAERTGETLAAVGWRTWPTARNTLLHVSPDELFGAAWILASYPFELGGLPVDPDQDLLPDFSQTISRNE